MKKILVFGVFDGVHEGHRHFLGQARELGDFLIAAVARDETVEILKGRRPAREFSVRKKELWETGLVDEIVDEDAKLGSWEVIGKCEPDIIALGYDQKELKTAILGYLREKDSEIEIRVMEGHGTDKYHSSILDGR